MKVLLPKNSGGMGSYVLKGLQALTHRGNDVEVTEGDGGGSELTVVFSKVDFKKLAGVSGSVGKLVNNYLLLPKVKDCFDAVKGDRVKYQVLEGCLIKGLSGRGIDTEISENWEVVYNYCKQTGLCVFDFEATGLDWYADTFRVTLLSVSFQAGSSYIIPIDQIPQFIAKVAADKDIVKVAHNMAYDYLVAKKWIKRKRGMWFDTMLAAKVLYSDRRVGLKELTRQYFTHYAGYEDELDGYGWENIPYNILRDYGSIDTDITCRLYYIFKAELSQNKRTENYFWRIQMSALWTLIDIQARGVKVNIKKAKELQLKAEDYLERREQEIKSWPDVVRFERAKLKELKKLELERVKSKLETSKQKKHWQKKLAEVPKMTYSLNFNSPKQMKEFVYTDRGLGLTPMVEQGEKVYSCAEHVLKNYDHPFFELYWSRNKIDKLKSTYIDAVLELSYNGRVYPSYHQAVTATGRLSCSSPNLQNFPKRVSINCELYKELLDAVLELFEPDGGGVFFQADYSQIELRVIAELSGDDVMKQAYKDGKDLHTLTALKVLDISEEQWAAMSDEDRYYNRTSAKAVNFGNIFGQGDYGFMMYAKNTFGVDLTIEQARTMQKAFFELYSGIKNYQVKDIYLSKKRGYCETLFGRRRYVDLEVGNIDNILMNTPVQGTAADLMLLTLRLWHLRSKVDLQITVHDSALGTFYDQSDLKVLSDTASNLPVEYYFGRGLDVPLEVDFEAGSDWKNLEEINL